MSRSTTKDDKERYLTYSITVRPANQETGVQEEVVTKKMAKFIEGGPRDFLDWIYHFDQLAKLKSWNPEDKILNAKILLEGDLLEAFENAEEGEDGDIRMDEEFTSTLYKVSKVVLPVDYNEKIQEELWEIRKTRAESLADYSKRFRALVRQEHTLADLSQTSKMCDDALCRLFKRGLPYDWQNKYDASGQVYTTIGALVPFFERIEQGEQRLHRHDSQNASRQQNGGNNAGRRGYGNRGNNRQQPRGGNRGRGGRGNGNNPGNNSGNNSHSSGNNNSGGNKYCTFHRTTTHITADCRSLRHDNNQQEEYHQADPRSASQPTRTEQRRSGVGSSSDDEYLFVGINDTHVDEQPPMRVMIKLESGKDRFQALLDSGCSRSIISIAFMQKLHAAGKHRSGLQVSPGKRF